MIKKLSAMALAGALTLTGVGNAFAYEVQSGDTMSEIAKTNNLSLQELSSLNPEIKDLNLIFIGQNVKTNQDKTQAVSVAVKPVEAVKVSTKATAYEIDLMARLVRAEAENEPYAGKVAVAYVILNRVSSSQFPNSIKEVIYQSGQFSPVSNGSINRQADAESVRAVNEALNADRSDSKSLFFYNPKTATSRWLDGRETVTVIGNHVFKK